ncbi:MAG: M28 family peptidase [Flavobacterium sp.]|nr:M28 family peptidase [Candidatus Neoflavobacterium equi]
MKLKTFILPIFFFTASGIFAQSGVKPNTFKKLLKNINPTTLQKDLNIIASDAMAGRDTGSEGQKKAGLYLISRYEQMQIPHPPLAESYFQYIPAAFMQRPYSPKMKDSENIWAFIEGTDLKDEIVVISAHYDHVGTKNEEIYNGADDNGSGTAALLSIAQTFQNAKKMGLGPRRSILFLHVTAEEYGLHGSRYYAENPLYPLRNTVADVNIDMIGRIDDAHIKESKPYVYVVGSDRLSTELHKINEEMNTKFIKMNLDYKYNDKNDPEQIYYRSDHYNFAKKNIPSIFYFNGTHADYHLPGDTVDKINFKYLSTRAQLAFATAWEIANRAERIKVDVVE